MRISLQPGDKGNDQAVGRMNQWATTFGRDDQGMNVAGRGEADFFGRNRLRLRPRGRSAAGRLGPAGSKPQKTLAPWLPADRLASTSWAVSSARSTSIKRSAWARSALRNWAATTAPPKPDFGSGTERQGRNAVGGVEPIEERAGKLRVAVEFGELAITRPATCQRSSSGAMRGRLSVWRSAAVTISRRWV